MIKLLLYNLIAFLAGGVNSGEYARKFRMPELLEHRPIFPGTQMISDNLGRCARFMDAVTHQGSGLIHEGAGNTAEALPRLPVHIALKTGGERALRQPLADKCH